MACRLRQLKSARKLLRDFNTASKHQLDVQLADIDQAAQLLTSIREDLDHIYARLRWAPVMLLFVKPELMWHVAQAESVTMQ